MTARKSNQVKKLAGTFRPQREVSPDFLQQLAELPEPPEELPDGAKRQWLALAPAVCAAGIASADLAAFQLLTVTLATAEECRRQIEREGYTVPSSKFGSRSHPAVTTMQQSRAQAASLLQQFALTPRSRAGAEPPRTPTSVFGRNGQATTTAVQSEAAGEEFWSRFDLPTDRP
jgi:P27 family predicted phage terminase small subunit